MRNALQHLVSNWPFDIPFERSVRLNLIALERLQQDGLTWPSIASALTQAGGRHKSGRPISARQMNTVFLRVQKTARMTLINDTARQSPKIGSKAIVSNLPVQSVTQANSKMEIPGTIANAPSEHSASRRSDGLAQRLVEARRMRGAARPEYDE